ncbi:MAG: succinate dehydrogenase/fumarate reductase iron-sulfur subunit [Anaerolineales bacterium]
MKTLAARLQIRRTSHWQDYEVHVPPDAYVLDAIEAAGAQDSSLLYRHSCHHASCGSCGLRINGREYLPCITPLTRFKLTNRKLRLEPLRNFPIIGDLLVDPEPFMRKLDSVNMPPIRSCERAAGTQAEVNGIERLRDHHPADSSQRQYGFNRLENCIECGLCMSACPIVGSDAQYAGPAVLAAAGRVVSEPRGKVLGEVLSMVDNEHGVWRCHGAFECTQVCPAGVDPAETIMALRSYLLRPSGAQKAEGKV